MEAGAVAAQLEEILGAFTSPDNAVRQRAEEAWKDMKMRLPDEVKRNGMHTCGFQTHSCNHGEKCSNGSNSSVFSEALVVREETRRRTGEKCV